MMLQVLRLVVMVEAALVGGFFMGLAWNQFKQRRYSFLVRDLAATIAVWQVAAIQIIRFHAPLLYYATPVTVVWVTMLAIACWMKASTYRANPLDS